MRISDWSSDVCSSDLRNSAGCVQNGMWSSPDHSAHFCKSESAEAARQAVASPCDNTEGVLGGKYVFGSGIRKAKRDGALSLTGGRRGRLGTTGVSCVEIGRAPV